MTEHQLNQVKSIFSAYTAIKLVYFFGSRAENTSGPLSDFDFAIYFDEQDAKKMFDIKFELQDKIGLLLKTDNVDIVIINTSESPELKYNIIKNGKLIYEIEPFKVIMEPKILNEYFDFRDLLLRYNLTKA